MRKKLNAQYNIATPNSLSMRVGGYVRAQMFSMFMEEFCPRDTDEVLDLGVTSDQNYESSNYFEALYPYKNRITAAGIDDARFLETVFPGVRFQFADALDLPFEANSFDYVHAAAVLEHVGNYVNQQRMAAECLRVARKGICLTTPNRWFPIEVHTQLPFVHWLPKPWFRSILNRLGQPELAMEANLNLMTERELRNIAGLHPDWSFRFRAGRLLGWKSNIILFATKNVLNQDPAIIRRVAV